MKVKLDDSYIARRKFLGSMIGGGAAAMGAGVAVPLAAYVGNFREEPLPDFMAIDQADWDLSPGKSKIVMYGGIPVLIFKTPQPEGDLRVFVATCTHFDCTVSYRADENRIFCACHDGYYDVDGRVLSGPPPSPLREFAWKVLPDGKLVIALEKENLEKAS